MALSSLWRQRSEIDRRYGGRGLAMGALTLGGVMAVLIASVFLALFPPRSEAVPDGRETAERSQSEGDQGPDLAALLGSTHDAWTSIFRERGVAYRPPGLALSRDPTPSSCGLEGAVLGPSYCPGDQRVYLDPSFFELLSRRHPEAVAAAHAYVIAHEVGHHVQNLTGETERVQLAIRGRDRATQDALLLRLELQADCYAGVWAARRKQDPPDFARGDLEQALDAAAAIGEVASRRGASQRVAPETFTHGSAEQRARWFNVGFEQGLMEACEALPGA